MITRRTAVLGGLAAVGGAQSASAAIRCTPFAPNGVRQCEVGLAVQLNRIMVNTPTQQRQNWCWAACVSAIFGYHGFDVPQLRIVEKVFGADVNSPAIGPQIIRAIDGSWRDEAGRRFFAHGIVLWDAQFMFGDPRAAAISAQELSADRPLIVGALGHAMVLSGMTYLVDTMSRGQPLQLVVRDPWPAPGMPTRKILTGPQVQNTSFLAAVHIE